MKFATYLLLLYLKFVMLSTEKEAVEADSQPIYQHEFRRQIRTNLSSLTIDEGLRRRFAMMSRQPHHFITPSNTPAAERRRRVTVQEAIYSSSAVTSPIAVRKNQSISAFPGYGFGFKDGRLMSPALDRERKVSAPSYVPTGRSAPSSAPTGRRMGHVNFSFVNDSENASECSGIII